MKYTKEFRWFSENSKKNFPEELSLEQLTSSNILAEFDNVSCFTIYGPSRINFFVNGSYFPITIGPKNMIRYDSENIYSIRFDYDQLHNLDVDENLICKIEYIK